MGLTITSAGQKLFECSSFDKETFSFTTDLCLPGSLTLEVYNKNIFDTEVDENNKIKRDKHIKIKSLVVDNMLVPQEALYKVLTLVHSQGKSHGPYFGFNGSCEILIDTQNTFKWHMGVIADMQS